MHQLDFTDCKANSLYFYQIRLLCSLKITEPTKLVTVNKIIRERRKDKFWPKSRKFIPAKILAVDNLQNFLLEKIFSNNNSRKLIPNISYYFLALIIIIMNISSW